MLKMLLSTLFTWSHGADRKVEEKSVQRANHHGEELHSMIHHTYGLWETSLHDHGGGEAAHGQHPWDSGHL
jgi:hypothetical protein